MFASSGPTRRSMAFVYLLLSSVRLSDSIERVRAESVVGAAAGTAPCGATGGLSAGACGSAPTNTQANRKQSKIVNSLMIRLFLPLVYRRIRISQPEEKFRPFRITRLVAPTFLASTLGCLI